MNHQRIRKKSFHCVLLGTEAEATTSLLHLHLKNLRQRDLQSLFRQYLVSSHNRRGIVPAVVRGLLPEATSDKKSADNYLAATPRSPVVKEEANLTKQERAEILRL